MMTDQELQDLMRLKKYEQPEDDYFDDFLIEFQQRQRSEILKTSARALLIERGKAWFAQFGAMRWVIVAGVAYAVVSFVFNIIPKQEVVKPAMASTIVGSVNPEQEALTTESQSDEGLTNTIPISMVFVNPVDFSAPAPVFSADERVF